MGWDMGITAIELGKMEQEGIVLLTKLGNTGLKLYREAPGIKTNKTKNTMFLKYLTSSNIFSQSPEKYHQITFWSALKYFRI